MRHMARESIAVHAGWLRALAATLLAGHVLLALFVLWRAAVVTPFGDQVNWSSTWYQLQADHHWVAYLLSPHNLSRLVWVRLLIALDMGALGGGNAPLIVSGAVALGVMAALLGAQAARAAPEPLKLAWACVAVMLTLMAVNVLDASLPIFVTYLHGAAFGVLAVVLSEGAAPTDSAWRRVGAIATAMAAAFGSGAGLALWPVMAWGALRRRDWPWLAVVSASGAVFIGLYFTGQHDGTAADALPVLHHPKDALLLTLGYLFLPWTKLAPHLAWAAGLATACGAGALVLTNGGRKAAPQDRVACGLILFTLGTAAMAGLGRTGLESPFDVPIRYAILVAPLQTGVLMLAGPAAGRLWRRSRRWTGALIVALLLALTVQDAVLAVKCVRASDKIRNAIVAFQAGDRRPETLISVYPAPPFAEALYARLRRDGLYRHELHLKSRPAAR